MINRKLPSLLIAFVFSTVSIFAQTPCVGGFAGSYPCDGYTLQSFMPASTWLKGGDSFIEAQDSWGWTDTTNNKEYAIVALDVGTVFIDITDPVNPIYVGRLDSHTGSSLWRDVKVYQNHAYIVSDSNGNHGMQVYDLTQLEAIGSPPNNNLSETAWVTWGTSGSNRGRAHNLVINEATGIAYVVGVSPYNSGGPVFFDLSTPASPTYINRYSAGGYCHDAQVVTYNGPDTEHHGKEIMIGSFSSSDYVRILDVTNKASITELGNIQYTNRHYTHQGWFTEDQRYFIVGDELDEQNSGLNTRTLVLDLSDLDNPVLHYTYSASFSAIDHNGYVAGNRFYQAAYRAGMRVFKVDGLYDATPSMSEIAYFDTYPANNNTGFDGAWNVYPFFESGNIIVSGFGVAGTSGDGGLYILRDPNFDNTDPVASCQNITVTLNAGTGTASIVAADVDNGSSDNIAIINSTLTGQTSFTCADVGDTFNVTLTVEDDYGNTDSCVAQVTVQAATTEYLGGGSWSAGTPGAGSNAKIANDYDTAQGFNPSIDACTCEVDAGATLTIQANDYIDIENDITVNGTLVVKHQGSVVQTDDNATVTKNPTTGVINVELTTPPLKKRDFMVMGSPMDLETRTDVFGSAFLVLRHTPANFIPHPGVPPGGTNFADDNNDFWNQFASGPINVGEGYIVRPQAGLNDPIYTFPGQTHTFDMTYAEGTLNGGDVIRSITYNGGTNPDGTPNVLSNPYACAIDGAAFINDPANTLVNEVYFWEHLTPPSPSIPGANAWNFSMDDISMFNGSMGVPAANDPGTSTTPNGVISTGQGFGIKAFGNGTATFRNSMRLTTGNTTLRTPQGLETLTLRVYNEQYKIGSYMGIAFSNEATAQLDQKFDSNRLATFVSLYSHLQDGTEQLGIQTREAFDSEIKIPLGFATQATEEIEYTISIKDITGDNLSTARVFLYDNQENILTDLTAGDYEFKSSDGQFNGRFTLSFEQDVILGPPTSALQSVIVYPNPADNNINIYSPASYLTAVEVFDVRGRRLSQMIDAEQNAVSIAVDSLETGIYFVKVSTEAGSITKKIVKK